VEELLLGHLLPFQEVHVVHQEEVHVGAVPAPELGHGPAVDALDDLVDELLGPDVEDPGLGMALADGVGDGLHQVGLAEPRGPVDEERVVGLAGGLGGGVGRGGRELVRLPDHEGIERVPLVERLGARIGHLPVADLAFRPVGGGRHEEIHLRALLPVLVHAEDDGGGLADHRLGELREQRGVLGLVPLHRELVRGADDEPPFVERDRLRGLQPGPDRVIRKFAVRLVEDALPGVFGGQLHRDSKKRWGMIKGERCYGTAVEKSTVNQMRRRDGGAER